MWAIRAFLTLASYKLFSSRRVFSVSTLDYHRARSTDGLSQSLYTFQAAGKIRDQRLVLPELCNCVCNSDKDFRAISTCENVNVLWQSMTSARMSFDSISPVPRVGSMTTPQLETWSAHDSNEMRLSRLSSRSLGSE